eukprot:CAMPEP_0174696992 /NCGR_PEP_ID=MMETSP1094-20130205/2982_1 /TAXON_ID=156173 /ORGANISM="Chrysochromulina brevifilum, Strain UTEX LB 985" /LENGTH=40 /DNA_ID= /DNA_START= /DNA_END= /DNA_ORIENTATION=
MEEIQRVAYSGRVGGRNSGGGVQFRCGSVNLHVQQMQDGF